MTNLITCQLHMKLSGVLLSKASWAYKVLLSIFSIRLLIGHSEIKVGLACLRRPSGIARVFALE